MNYNIEELIGLVKEASLEVLMPYFNEVERSYKADGSVVTRADHQMQAFIQEKLKKLYPDSLLLGEEMSADEQADILQSGQSVWCLDPLDGTNNFTVGIPYFSISLALIEQGKVVLGIVYDPVRDECFYATEDQQSKLNGERLIINTTDLMLKQSIAIIDFKRLSKQMATRLVSDIPYSSQRSFGSVALDWCWLAAGRGHIYLHGRSNIWDYAAGQFIFTKAGGYSCTLEREPVFTDRLEPRSAVAAVDKNLFDAWLGWLMSATGE